ncbi:acyl-CoA dehydrogenase family protein [Aeromicrobium sp. Sec7.5]|uniref:acyl-CoA dehydrogenase family protein n=1 Tax=Aeromicrobium sp. Sec7.5 TaxID=3121276 RepID=UPI002FE48D5C
MDSRLDDAPRRMFDALRAFLDRAVRPAEATYREQLALQDDPWHWTAPPVLAELQDEAKELGLWNLFLPGDAGAGLTREEHQPLARLAATSPIGPVAINGAEPDTGVMTLLSARGTPAQRRRWLEPLLDARVRSSLASASRGTSIVRDGDEYVVTGLQPAVPGALNPDVRILVVTGQSDPDAAPGRGTSQVLVPRSADGVTVHRSTHVVGGRQEVQPGGLAVLVLDEVRVPVVNLLGDGGHGSVDAPVGLDRSSRRTG